MSTMQDETDSDVIGRNPELWISLRLSYRSCPSSNIHDTGTTISEPYSIYLFWPRTMMTMCYSWKCLIFLGRPWCLARGELLIGRWASARWQGKHGWFLPIPSSLFDWSHCFFFQLIKLSKELVQFFLLHSWQSLAHSWLFSLRRAEKLAATILGPFLGPNILNMAFGHMGCLMSVPWWMASFTNISFESTISSWPSNCNTPKTKGLQDLWP